MSVRKEIGDLSNEELQRFISALQEVKKSGFFDNYAEVHIQQSGGVHSAPIFFPWHRKYVNEFEKELQKIDSSVSLPYWDWTLDSQAPEKSMVFREDYFGGNGAGSSYCVQNGPFKSWKVGEQCLSRSFDGGDRISAFIAPEALKNILATTNSYKTFHETIEYGSHGLVHTSIGGNMATMRSSYDPLFWLHHSMIDKIWDDYQKISKKNMKDYPELDQILPYFNVPVSSVMDNSENCVIYNKPTRLTNRTGNEKNKSTTITTVVPTVVTTTSTPPISSVSTSLDNSSFSDNNTSDIPTPTSPVSISTIVPTDTDTVTSTEVPTETSQDSKSTTASSTTESETFSTTTSSTSEFSSTTSFTTFATVTKTLDSSFPTNLPTQNFTLYSDNPTVCRLTPLQPIDIEHTDPTIVKVNGKDDMVLPDPFDRSENILIRSLPQLPEYWIKMNKISSEVVEKVYRRQMKVIAALNYQSKKYKFLSVASRKVVNRSGERVNKVKYRYRGKAALMNSKSSLPSYYSSLALVFAGLIVSIF
ncbi:Tyrosinase domain-containing protein [Rozella allomycis CSF55]|uniref:Tyrosinase domain-containing protein n=1 Tax=Rozella allomycis (strain CSF55) TaxID=988480 RepID=A0A075AX41_ROZAC|nr:Tyrosinase domain-containing protein [Rozella allomycis CSF55]|eukprot:EPZ33292.1 Tyrosinase domain-containing protein [Rozella allomycis CSF55]